MKVLRAIAALTLLVVSGLWGTGTFDSANVQRSYLPNANSLTAFGIFDTPEERLSEAEYVRVRSSVERFEPGAQILRSQRAHTSHGSLWVLATSNLICIVRSDAAACGSKHEAIVEGVALGVFSPPDQRHPGMHNFLLQGLFPDDVAQVSALINSRRHIMVSATRNIVSIAGDQPIQLDQLLRR